MNDLIEALEAAIRYAEAGCVPCGKTLEDMRLSLLDAKLRRLI